MLDDAHEAIHTSCIHQDTAGECRHINRSGVSVVLSQPRLLVPGDTPFPLVICFGGWIMLSCLSTTLAQGLDFINRPSHG